MLWLAAAAAFLVLVSTLGGDIVVTDLPSQDDHFGADDDGMVFIEDANQPPFVVSGVRVLQEAGDPGQAETSDGLLGPPRMALVVNEPTPEGDTPLGEAQGDIPANAGRDGNPDATLARGLPLADGHPVMVEARFGTENGGRDGDAGPPRGDGPVLMARFDVHLQPDLGQADLRGCPETGTGTLCLVQGRHPTHNIREPVPVSGQPLSPIVPEIGIDKTPPRWALARLERQPEAVQVELGASSPKTIADKKPAPTVLVRLQPPPANGPGPAVAQPPAQKAQAAMPAALDLDARPINALNTDTRIGEGDRPSDVAEARLTLMNRQVSFTAVAQRDWVDMLYDWEAPGLCHNPLYFEEVNLERYGYRWPCAGVLQPVVSCGQFFSTVPALPYKLVAESPRECVYTLGHYRPGSAVPYQVHFPRWRPGAGAAEAGVIAGLIFAIP